MNSTSGEDRLASAMPRAARADFLGHHGGKAQAAPSGGVKQDMPANFADDSRSLLRRCLAENWKRFGH
jgi:hypothetical protein